MALVVLLRGVNVGGHKTFRPSVLAGQLKQFDAVNIGAAGTFVIRKKVGKTQLRSELLKRLPFDTKIIICDGQEILEMLDDNPFWSGPAPKNVVRFVSVLSAIPHTEPKMPFGLPTNSRWLLRILGRRNRFVFGEYRRDPKVIQYLGKTDSLFDVPVTTRNWNTIVAIARVLNPN